MDIFRRKAKARLSVEQRLTVISRLNEHDLRAVLVNIAGVEGPAIDYALSAVVQTRSITGGTP